MIDEALKQARETGYLTNRGNDQQLRDEWMSQAQVMGMPYVEVVFTESGVAVTWHVGHLDPHISVAAQAVAMTYTEQHPGRELWC